MLQIISGKFFSSDDRIRHQGKGIIYSNYSWVAPVETCVASLEPVDTFGSVASYVISYENQIEKEQPPEKNILVRAGDSEIVEQFELLCAFGLKAFFHQDKNTVDISCREHRFNSTDRHVPSDLVPRFFQRQLNGSVGEVESFVKFVAEVIGLPRRKYLLVIRSMRNFVYALSIIGHNVDLAYSLFIYSLESLSQSFDNYEPVWEDYHEDIRLELDSILEHLPNDTSSRFRNVLLQTSHLKATSRFVTFVTDLITDDFFKSEAPQGVPTLRSFELKKALRNAYSMRSRFAHQLKPVQEQLKHPKIATGDVVRWENQPFLSLAGLIRIAYHAIKEFINRQKGIATERIDWRSQLPGIMQLEMAPQYWIWKHEELKQEYSGKRLSGFLQQFETVKTKKGSLTDLRDLLKACEKKFPNMKKNNLRQFMTIFILYNMFAVEEGRVPNYKEIIDRYRRIFDKCSIEGMLIETILNQQEEWNADECADEWNLYRTRKFNRGELVVPFLLEIAIMVRIAFEYLAKDAEDNVVKYNQWIDSAVLDSAGNYKLQSRLEDLKKNRVALSYEEIIMTQTGKA